MKSTTRTVGNRSVGDEALRATAQEFAEFNGFDIDESKFEPDFDPGKPELLVVTVWICTKNPPTCFQAPALLICIKVGSCLLPGTNCTNTDNTNYYDWSSILNTNGSAAFFLSSTTFYTMGLLLQVIGEKVRAGRSVHQRSEQPFLHVGLSSKGYHIHMGLVSHLSEVLPPAKHNPNVLH